MDRTTVELPRVEARAKNAFDKRGDRPQFLKGIYKNGMVELLDGQSSSMLQTFVFIPAEVSRIEIDSLVTAIVLPA
jgi:molybdopterin molybdotransferase